MLEGQYEPTEDFVKALYDCLLCGACSTVGCVVDKDHVPMFRDMRTDLVNMGMPPPEPFRKTAAGIEKEGNRFGRPRQERGKWAEGMEIPGEADLVYFAGCVASYRAPQLAQATARVLKHSGTRFAILGEEEQCCGNPLLSSGQMELFGSVARSNIAALKKAGAKQVVTSCACGYNVLKFDYPKVAGELDFEVIHLTELLAKLLKEGRIEPEKAVNAKVAYQDPCHLVRLGGRVIKEPREVINSIPGVELVEMEGSGRDTQCCGRFPVELPELSMLTGTNRVNDAMECGADTIVTACSFCDWNLRRAAKSAAADIEVIDIGRMLSRTLGIM